MIIFGVILIPDLKIKRFHNEIGEYYLVFSKENILALRNKYHKSGNDKNFSLEHGKKESGIKMIKSFLITKKSQKTLPIEFQHLPIGTWMVALEIDKKMSKKIERRNLRGFSIEGNFTIVGPDGKKYNVSEKLRVMNKPSELPFRVHVFGGSTDGAGRNEHGEAHFQLEEKNTRKSIGKILMPKLDDWNNADKKEKWKMLSIINDKDIKNNEKKQFAKWLDENNNLENCHNEWNEKNKHNNRVNYI